MRRTALFLLLATAAVPAFAAPDRNDEREAREERWAAHSQTTEERQAERPKRSEQSERQLVRSAQQRGSDSDKSRQQYRETVDQQSPKRRLETDPADRPTLEQRRAAQEQRRDAVEAARESRQEQRIERRIERRPPPVVSNVPSEGTQPPPPSPTTRPSHSSNSHNWNSNWRHDHRYDWYNWRNRHRSLFHFGFYSDPFGWGYRPYSIGWRLWPSYYGSNYWLNDPWMYRLPPAYPGTRWIRYYEDALLIDTWSGEVVDVIYNFFW